MKKNKSSSVEQQLAELQTLLQQKERGLEIEAALERVRAKALAMHHTSELQNVINTVAQQFLELEMDISGGAFICINKEIENEIVCWGAGDTADYVQKVRVPFLDRPINTNFIKELKKGPGFFTESFSHAEKIEFFKHLFKYPPYSATSKAHRKNILSYEGGYTRSCAVGNHTTIFILNHHGRKFSNADNEILARFGNVFEQSYVRFLDLAKAEIQAKEAQIEAALEKVRSRSMAMHQSSELSETASIMFHQVQQLGIDLLGCGFTVIDDDDKTGRSYFSLGGVILPDGIPMDVKGNKEIKAAYAAWKKKEAILVKTIKGAALKKHHEAIEKQAQKRMAGKGIKIKEAYQNTRRELPTQMTTQVVFFSRGWLIFNTVELISNQDLLFRFSKVFEQSYTRFLDLKKAEAQAREAQIEAALEKVRSRSMAMHHSDELSAIAPVLYEQLKALGAKLWNLSFIIFQGDSDIAETWAGDSTGALPKIIIPHLEESINTELYQGWKSKKPLTIIKAGGSRLKQHQKYMAKLPGFEQVIAIRKAAGLKLPEERFFYGANFKYGYLMFNSGEAIPDFHDIFIRFAQVFEQTYTRFLDLQKAETQAREAQIEAALEKVRSASMAMHKSEELASTAQVLFKQLELLKIETWAAGFNICEEDSPISTAWISLLGQIQTPFPMPHDVDPSFRRIYEHWKKKDSIYIEEIGGEELVQHYKYMFKLWNGPNKLTEDLAENGFGVPELPKYQVFNAAYFKQGYLMFITYEINPVHQIIYKRFAQAFEQTYTRFLDLQKAEAQAREAQIEVALERVRSRTMAMHKSDELAEVASVMFKQLVELGSKPYVCAFTIIDSYSGSGELWMCDAQGNVIPRFGLIPSFQGEKHFEKVYAEWKNKASSYSYNIAGDELKKMDQWVLENTTIPLPENFEQANISPPEELYFFIPYFSEGYLLISGYQDFSQEESVIFIRFAKVFQQTYTRFLDLQKAEALAREAQIEAALERVRARAMAMRHSNELSEAAELLYNEFLKLGVESFSCGYLINDDEKTEWKIWLTNPGEKFFKEFWTAPFYGDDVLKNRYESWKNKEDFHCAVLEGAVNKKHNEYITTLAPWKEDMLDSLPFRLVFNSANFSLGHLLVISPDRLSPELEQAMVRFAGVFDLAYRRFLDLQKAEAQSLQIRAERDRLEKALENLQATQAQLIQSEKMASLGELTAGIAHEIQNPLNFVNNFSKVSNELLEEMEEELDKGEKEEVKEIMGLLSQNLEKINHHGSRASSIVKGMLQHSRTSKGEKEPTDINALCDEYLRLAYHGVRAKNKTFNATMETSFDESIKKIEVIPQDIGRVILNLITNAFYAAPLPPEVGFKDPNHKHDPTIWVSTNKVNDKVLISVRDNGPGIPEKIIDKIFQPFFTTKPTGQGTGLGLSLSYDIVNAHGGELKVESEEGEGSTFIICLPVV